MKCYTRPELQLHISSHSKDLTRNLKTKDATTRQVADSLTRYFTQTASQPSVDWETGLSKMIPSFSLQHHYWQWSWSVEDCDIQNFRNHSLHFWPLASLPQLGMRSGHLQTPKKRLLRRKKEHIGPLLLSGVLQQKKRGDLGTWWQCVMQKWFSLYREASST